MTANTAADAASRTATNATTKSFLVILNPPRRAYRRAALRQSGHLSPAYLYRSPPPALPKLHADRRASQPSARARRGLFPRLFQRLLPPSSGRAAGQPLGEQIGRAHV